MHFPAGSTRRVDSGGVRLAVTEYGAPSAEVPTVVLVHGYPDRQQVWHPVVEALAARVPGVHAVTYDVRGAGGSDVPPHTRDYRTERLVDDLAAVLGAVLPKGGAAHLVGHDWGSVQLWEALAAESADPRLRGRIASFTSISGPSLSHVGRLSRHPAGRRLRLLRQAAHSWYIYLFLVPVLPELLWRAGHRVLPHARVADAVHGLELYRANLGHRRGSTRHAGTHLLHTDVPVTVLHPTRDAFLTDVLLEDLDRSCSRLRVERIDAGHWVIRTRPEAVAALVADQVRA